MEDFRAANPQINADCTNLWAATAYCVYQVKKDPMELWAELAMHKPCSIGTPTTSVSSGTPVPTATMPPTTPAATDACTYDWCSATWTDDIGLPTPSVVTTTSGSTSATPTSTGVPRPTNAAPNSISNCKKWYTVQSGDYCYLICQNQGCTVPNLQTWNPDLGSDCIARLGVAYCVSA
ncbi:LysM domain protein [Ceratobasidium sp. AG-Ba]|nr:LysM domain protein [Ceratobasidium sp. AG-Ba]